MCNYLHPEFQLYQLLIKISSVLSNQKIVMQPFDLYNFYGTLITKFPLLKFPFRALRLHLSSHSSPFFFPPLTTQEPTAQHPVQFVPFFFEVLGPDTLETVICLASSSSSNSILDSGLDLVTADSIVVLFFSLSLATACCLLSSRSISVFIWSHFTTLSCSLCSCSLFCPQQVPVKNRVVSVETRLVPLKFGLISIKNRLVPIQIGLVPFPLGPF